jgi:hypothetical protein
LFGRNVTGGAVILRNARPAGEFGAKVRVGLDDEEQFNVAAAARAGAFGLRTERSGFRPIAIAIGDEAAQPRSPQGENRHRAIRINLSGRAKKSKALQVRAFSLASFMRDSRRLLKYSLAE